MIEVYFAWRSQNRPKRPEVSNVYLLELQYENAEDLEVRGDGIVRLA
jgi:hypothetical protein